MFKPKSDILGMHKQKQPYFSPLQMNILLHHLDSNVLLCHVNIFCPQDKRKKGCSACQWLSNTIASWHLLFCFLFQLWINNKYED